MCPRRWPRAPYPASMLDLEFAELSDVGRVRDHNEDYSGHVLPASELRRPHARLALRRGRRRGRGRAGEVASQTAIETLIAGFRAAPQRRGAHGSDAAPRSVRQHPHLRAWQGRQPRRIPHGDHHRGLRLPLRSRRGGARGRFPLLSDPPRGRPADHPRPYRGCRTGAARFALGARGRRSARRAICSAARSATIFS